MTTELTHQEATAAGSGNAATEQFRGSGKLSTSEVLTERVSLLVNEVLAAVYATVRIHKVTYQEFNALKAWLISVGEAGEWPLFMDVWVEHVIEEVSAEAREGSKGTIEGPYYVPGAPLQHSPAVLPMRVDEGGTPLVFHGQVRGVSGASLPGAVVEIWHADDDGFYSQFAPGIPKWNLRATIIADDNGQFSITTVQPAPHQIPTDGACGKLIAAAGWHAWRPAHLHVKVAAPGHQLLTAQLYFEGDQHLSDDFASAVKPELVLSPTTRPDAPGNDVGYDFVLDPTVA